MMRAGRMLAQGDLRQLALDNLRDVAVSQIGADEDAETKVVEVLARAAQEMKKKS